MPSLEELAKRAVGIDPGPFGPYPNPALAALLRAAAGLLRTTP